MMAPAWTTPADLRAQLERRWLRGDLARALVAEQPAWPMRLSLRGPSAAELSERFESARAWVAQLTATPNIRIEWRELSHRVLGRQRIPDQVWIDHADQALALIGKCREGGAWREIWHSTGEQLPALLPWLERRPLQALALAEHWQRLLAVCHWCMAHPRSGLYLRQVDIPGVHSKFIETHRSTLAEWLDLLLPAETIAADAVGVNLFARRYGFREKPTRIRFRLLDAGLSILPGCGGRPDITLDADSFARLALPIRRVFITENETNFLAFPDVAQAIVIFGGGYGWDALARADWLSQCPIHYWGDIDSHGFIILDRLRQHLPHVQSLLMDRETLHRHRVHWGEEPIPTRIEPHHLTPDEFALFDDLRTDRIAPRVRLEQEHIQFTWLSRAVACLIAPGLGDEQT